MPWRAKAAQNEIVGPMIVYLINWSVIEHTVQVSNDLQELKYNKMQN